MNDENIFTKEHTEIVKGMAIILMLIHHLFAFPDRINVEGYISIMQLKGINIEVIAGQFGKICIGMYLFLSGYGMYYALSNNGEIKFRDSCNRLKKLYINYWIVFVLFIPIGFIFLENEFNLSEFILNFMGLVSSYNKEWWFLRTYAELMVLFPIIYKILGNNIILGFLKTLLIFSIALVCNIIFKIIPKLDFIKEIWVYNEIYNILLWQCVFSVGYLFSKFNLYTKIKQVLEKIKCSNKIFYFILIIIVIITRQYKGHEIFKDPMLVPIFIFAIINILDKYKIKKVFNYLGKNSTNMWLTHTFFCYYYFQYLTFYPKISVLILIWLVVLSLSVSNIINYILKCIEYKCQQSKVSLDDLKV